MTTIMIGILILTGAIDASAWLGWTLIALGPVDMCLYCSKEIRLRRAEHVLGLRPSPSKHKKD